MVAVVLDFFRRYVFREVDFYLLWWTGPWGSKQCVGTLLECAREMLPFLSSFRRGGVFSYPSRNVWDDALLVGGRPALLLHLVLHSLLGELVGSENQEGQLFEVLFRH